jgi:hypothetical protein
MRILLAACVVSLALPAPAQIVRVGDVNTTQIGSLDPSKTVVRLGTRRIARRKGNVSGRGGNRIVHQDFGVEGA